MPCVDGIPQEFAAQDAYADYVHAKFPGTRVLEYRIGTAVPYAQIVHDAMVEHPDWFVRWHHSPNNNMSVCTVPPEHKTGPPYGNCSWEIRAGMYDFSQEVVRDWYIENIIKPVMVHGDGVWLDGDGPDNGAYQCSGSYSWGNLPAPYPALNSSEVDAFCAGEVLMWEAAHSFLASVGSFDAQACWSTISGPSKIPARSDSASTCGAKLAALDALPSDPLPVLFAGERTAGVDYTDQDAPQVIASFLLVRKDHWFFGIQQQNVLTDEVGTLLLSDYGAPLGNMTVTGTVYSREFEKATVSLDCATYTPSFVPH